VSFRTKAGGLADAGAALFLFFHAAAAPGLASGIPRPDHVVIVVEENRAASVVGSDSAPYINSLAARGALMTEYFAISHPSEPNYLALFSGSTQGVSDDSCPHTFSSPNLGSGLLGAGLTFAGYSESLPAAGSEVCTACPYARKHVPWINFSNVPQSLHLSFSQFPSDYTQLPTVSFVIPNLDNDMHDGTTAQADAWLQQHIDPYVQWAQDHNSLLIVTWDEGAAANQVATIFVGPMVQPGEYCGRVTHYNLLRTVEDMFVLPSAGQSVSAAPIAQVWRAGTPPPETMLTQPANGASFVAPTNITLSGDALAGAGDIQRIEFFSGATKLGEATTFPYSMVWSNVSPGTWCLRAKATDTMGWMQSSSNVTITVTGKARNPFLAVRGSYTGAVATATNSGAARIAVTPRGAFLGRLTFGRARVAFHGRFDQAGSAEVLVKRRRRPTLTIALTLDFATPQVSGTVDDGTLISTFSASKR